MPTEVNLRLRRVELGLTLRELSKLSGIGPSTISQIERGEQKVSEKQLTILRKVLRC